MNAFNVNSCEWLPQARLVVSPNYDTRPPDTTIDLLVIHSMSLPNGQFGGPYIDALFTNTLDVNAHPTFASLEGLKVSAHLVIDRQGIVTQYVPLALRAWHAGLSNFQGRSKCNDFSIGIELEGCDTIPFAKPQYQTLISITQTIMRLYPAITLQNIVGHNQIAPGRKTDPGPLFEWDCYRRNLEANLSLA